MTRLIASLARSAGLRRLFRTLRLHLVGNAWLRLHPKTSRLPNGTIYRATRLESIPLAHEMFEQGTLYDAALLPPGFTNFADLGCNVGYFTCWLAEQAAGRRLKGLMLDANPSAVVEAQWHAQTNGLQDVHAIHGIAGEGLPPSAVQFHLYESNICSSSQMPDVEKLGLRGNWTTISVPCIRLDDEWRARFGDARCHLLKVDIEGSEVNFLKAEQAFLQQVDSILIEYHLWRVTLGEIRDLLAPLGFNLVKILDEQEQMGTAYFRRS
jgi:FkbM family methyltransferase